MLHLPLLLEFHHRDLVGAMQDVRVGTRPHNAALLEQGGMPAIEQINTVKSQNLYQRIDASIFYRGTAESGDRSKMNVCFRLPEEELESKFVKEAQAAGLVGLQGHRAVGGIRASLYNAMPLAGVSALIDFMNEFEEKNG